MDHLMTLKTLGYQIDTLISPWGIAMKTKSISGGLIAAYGDTIPQVANRLLLAVLRTELAPGPKVA